MSDISANRTDLFTSAPGSVPADTQGEKADRERQLAAIPISPGQRGPATRPTERPSEPVTSGLTTGPGQGPVSGDLTPLDRVRAAYRRVPSEPLRMALEVMERAEARGLRR